MKIKNTVKTLLIIACLGLATGCMDLDVKNLNHPDLERVLVTPEDYRALLAGGYNAWWRGSHANRLPFAHFDGWADNMTTTNEYQIYYSMSTQEPRNRIDNSTGSDGYLSMQTPWQHLNSAVSIANDLINYIEVNGNSIVIDRRDETMMLLSMAYLLRGISKGYLANFFDQAYIINETITDLRFQPYTAVLESALDDIDRAVQFAETNSFTTFNFLSNVAMSNQELIGFANSQAAKFIISNGRSSDHYTRQDWQRVVDYASNGLGKDLIINGTGTAATGWRHEYQRQSGLDWYWKTDLRIINLMDPNYPMKYPVKAAQNAYAIPPAQSSDARLELDFNYDPHNLHRFVTARGPQLQSVYYYTRYEDLYLNQGFGDIVVFRKENIDMMLAEAYVHLGQTPLAINLLNAGSRVNRGTLPPVPANATDQDVLDAVYYEVEIDLQRTWVGYQYFLARRRDMLQEGTPLHLPVPSEELQLLEKPVYTFGGTNFTHEDGTADGANSWDKDWVPGMYDHWYDNR
jgi:starch-binding outer membrane protein, SusD/RagB family